MKSATSSTNARTRRKFTPEFKDEAIKLCKEPGQSIAKVAKTLAVTPTTVRAWVKQHDIDGGKGPSGALTTIEKQELADLLLPCSSNDLIQAV